MTTYLCHFHVVTSVGITIELELETKHYGEDALTTACRLLANKLDITFIYFEVK